MNQYVMVILQTGLGVAVVIGLARLAGLRSFSKLSSFDFALTLAIGSLLASAATTDKAPWPELLALATIFGLRMALAIGRRRFPFFESLTDNTPLLLLRDGQILDKNLSEAKITREEIIAKLREANVLDLDKVRAVVLETTGNISVLHGDHLDERLLANVRDGRTQKQPARGNPIIPTGLPAEPPEPPF